MVIVVSSAGLLISAYFALVFHGVVKADSKHVPSVCRMDEQSCRSILNVREAKLLGFPNFYLGILFYVALIAFALNHDELAEFGKAAVIASGGAVCVSLYLGYSLFFVIRKRCVLCLTAHVFNIVLFLSLVL